MSMNKAQFTAAIVLVSMFAVTFAPVAAASSTPVISLPPATLPAYTYYINGTENHYTITSSEWSGMFTSVFNNRTLITYNWANNTTEDLILFDLSYTGLNSFGREFISALSFVGAPSAQNYTKAFENVKNLNSLVQSGGSTMTNLQALNTGAYPGFSWSQPKVKSLTSEYQDAAIIGAIIAATFVLYFYFNRRR